MNLFKKVANTKASFFLITVLFVFFLLRLPSLFEPLWYGDEGIYQVLGLSMNDGRLLYKETWDNKPPMLYVFYALTGSDQFTIRFVSLLFGIGAVIAFFMLSQKLFQNPKAQIVSTILFTILFGIPMLEGNIANAENFMLFPILVAAYLINRHYESLHPKILVVCGFLLSFAFLFKIVGIFDFAAFFVFLLFITFKEKRFLISEVTKLGAFIGAFVIPIFITMLYFIFNNAFSDFYNAVFQQNINYVGYGNTFIIAQGLLLLKLFLLGVTLLILFLKRNYFSHAFLFIVIWVSFSLFNAFFSGRPYTHYLLVLVPSFCLFVAAVFFGLQKNHSRKHFVLGLLLLFFLLQLLDTNFWIYKKNRLYYQNFISYITGQKHIDAYRSFFDGNTPYDYQISQYLKLHLKDTDNLFVWGNNAQMYTMTQKLPPGRFTVRYHMTNNQNTLKETYNDLNRNIPNFILVTNPKIPFPFSLQGYVPRAIIHESVIYERNIK